MKTFNVNHLWQILIVLLTGSFGQTLSAQNWTSLSGIKAQDIGVGKNGIVWATGIASEIYRLNGSAWEKMPGAASRLAVDPSGNAWVVNAGGEVWQYLGNDYISIGGVKAKDIGIGANGTVWVVATNSEIFKRNGTSWAKIPGGAVRIAVDPSGNGWVVNNGGEVWQYDGEDFNMIGGVTAKDIGIGADGSVWVTGKDGKIYKKNGSNWNLKNGAADQIAVGPLGSAYVVNTLGDVQAMKEGNTSGAKSVADYIATLKYDPIKILNVNPNPTNNPIKVSDEKPTAERKNGKVILCTSVKYNLSSNAEEVGILRPSGDIFPGALIHANYQLVQGQPTPIKAERMPVRLSIEGLPNISSHKSKGIITVEDPDNANVSTALDEILGWWSEEAKNKNWSNAANISNVTTVAYSEQQVAMDLGISYSDLTTTFKGSFGLSSRTSRKVTYMVYKQVYYTVNYEVPREPSNVFKADVTFNQIKAAFDNSRPPAYVQSVKYGRIVIFRAETDNKYLDTDIKAAMEYGAGEQKVGGSVEAKYKSILENSSIQYVVIGGNADAAAKTAMAKSYGDLKNLIESGGQFSSKNPGVPIVYTVKFLKDNQVAKMGYATDFVKVECEEKEEMFVKLSHDGGYIAKFKISWTEDGKDKSWDSGEKTAGYSETVELPYTAQDIRIAAWAATGLIWDPWGEIINKLVTKPLDDLNKCYRAYGTTLSRHWDNNCK